jgi:fructokinase
MVPAIHATVADTIGAGDTVTAAIVDALWGLGVVGTAASDGLLTLRAADWIAVLEHAGRAAAITVSRPGGDPPWRHELG